MSAEVNYAKVVDALAIAIKELNGPCAVAPERGGADGAHGAAAAAAEHGGVSDRGFFGDVGKAITGAERAARDTVGAAKESANVLAGRAAKETRAVAGAVAGAANEAV